MNTSFLPGACLVRAVASVYAALSSTLSAVRTVTSRLTLRLGIGSTTSIAVHLLTLTVLHVALPSIIAARRVGAGGSALPTSTSGVAVGRGSVGGGHALLGGSSSVVPLLREGLLLRHLLLGAHLLLLHCGCVSCEGAAVVASCAHKILERVTISLNLQ